MEERNTIVGVFHDRAQAQAAIQELRSAGFRDDQIGLMAGEKSAYSTSREDLPAEEGDTYAEEGGVTGLAAGAGVGALWGLGIVAGLMPPLGPAIAGGALAAVLTSAAAGAAAAGLAGTLIGLGIPKEEAEYYESELQSGRIIVTVQPGGRHAQAMSIIQRNGGYDASSRSSRAAATMTPATGGYMEGRDVAAGDNVSGQPPIRVPVSEEEVRAQQTRRGDAC